MLMWGKNSKSDKHKNNKIDRLMDRCPANYSLLAWLPGDVAKLLLLITVDQLDPDARRLPGPTHGWLLTQ